MDLTRIELLMKDLLMGTTRFFEIKKDGSCHHAEDNGISYPGDYSACIHSKEILVPFNENPNFHPTKFLGICVDDYIKNYTKKSTNYRSDNTKFMGEQTFGPDVRLLLTIEFYKSLPDTQTSVKLSLSYHGLVVAVYDHKTTRYNHEVTHETEGIYDLDFIKNIDFSKFAQTSQEIYAHGNIFTYDKSLVKDPSRIWKLCVIDDTFYLSDSFHWVKSHTYKTSDYGKDLFVKLGVKKIIIQQIRPDLRDFNFAQGTIIDFDVKKSSNPNNNYRSFNKKETIKSIIGDNPNIRPYLPEIYKSEVDRISFLQEEHALWRTPLTITFKYGNLNGFVLANAYKYREFCNFYAQHETISLDVAGHILELDKTAFDKCFTIDRKLKGRKKLDSAIQFFGTEKIGYTEWWLKKFDKGPEQI